MLFSTIVGYPEPHPGRPDIADLPRIPSLPHLVSQFLINQVSAKVLMKLAGHKHLSTTQRYIEVNAQTLKEVVELA